MPPQPQQTREQFIETLFATKKSDNIHSDKDARKKLVAGISKGVEAIAVSYGSAGSNAIIEEDIYPYSRTSNDGKAILGAMKLADPVENIGLNFLKEVADKSDRESGDGRKSTVILTGAILKEGMKVEANPMDIKRSLDECLPIIIKSIEAQTKPIEPENVGTIATIASENPELGKIFQEIYTQIGKDGIVELDNSNLPDTSYEITEGVKLLGCGFSYPYMANEDKGRKAVYEYPYVLITKQKIQHLTQIDPLLKAIKKQGRNELVIFCNDIDVSVSQSLAYLHIQGTQEPDGSMFMFKTLVIKAPVLWKDWLFDDFAKITGATIIDPAQGTTLKVLQLHQLGTCEKVITSKDETIVLGTKDISDHLKALQEEGTDEAKIRASRLQTKTAILKLGANSETELSYIKGKALDARNASYLALNGGVVPGGGVTLSKASAHLPDTIGGQILSKALNYPLKQICGNLGIKIVAGGTIFGKDILDPAIVVKNSITNAISVASTILTTETVITKKQ